MLNDQFPAFICKQCRTRFHGWVTAIVIIVNDDSKHGPFCDDCYNRGVEIEVKTEREFARE